MAGRRTVPESGAGFDLVARPIRQGRQRIDPAVLRELRVQIPGWRVGRRLARTFQFADFPQAMAFVNRVAKLAQDADHHPDIEVRYARVALKLWTHDAGGLTENDLIVAAQIDRLLDRSAPRASARQRRAGG